MRKKGAVKVVVAWAIALLFLLTFSVFAASLIMKQSPMEILRKLNPWGDDTDELKEDEAARKGAELFLEDFIKELTYCASKEPVGISCKCGSVDTYNLGNYKLLMENSGDQIKFWLVPPDKEVTSFYNNPPTREINNVRYAKVRIKTTREYNKWEPLRFKFYLIDIINKKVQYHYADQLDLLGRGETYDALQIARIFYDRQDVVAGLNNKEIGGIFSCNDVYYGLASFRNFIEALKKNAEDNSEQMGPASLPDNARIKFSNTPDGNLIIEGENFVKINPLPSEAKAFFKEEIQGKKLRLVAHRSDSMTCSEANHLLDKSGRDPIYNCTPSDYYCQLCVYRDMLTENMVLNYRADSYVIDNLLVSESGPNIAFIDDVLCYGDSNTFVTMEIGSSPWKVCTAPTVDPDEKQKAVAFFQGYLQRVNTCLEQNPFEISCQCEQIDFNLLGNFQLFYSGGAQTRVLLFPDYFNPAQFDPTAANQDIQAQGEFNAANCPILNQSPNTVTHHIYPDVQYRAWSPSIYKYSLFRRQRGINTIFLYYSDVLATLMNNKFEGDRSKVTPLIIPIAPGSQEKAVCHTFNPRQYDVGSMFNCKDIGAEKEYFDNFFSLFTEASLNKQDTVVNNPPPNDCIIIFKNNAWLPGGSTGWLAGENFLVEKALNLGKDRQHGYFQRDFEPKNIKIRVLLRMNQANNPGDCTHEEYYQGQPSLGLTCYPSDTDCKWCLTSEELLAVRVQKEGGSFFLALKTKFNQQDEWAQTWKEKGGKLYFIGSKFPDTVLLRVE